MKTILLFVIHVVIWSVGVLCVPASARQLQANPSTYNSALSALVPGDTLLLAGGTYQGLTLQNINGAVSSWICVLGPAQAPIAVIAGRSCCNTVQIYNCSYLAVKNLDINLGGLDVDGVNAKDYPTHHILIENCTIHNFPANSQQIVGISTKSLAWAWTIRNNTIVEPGTGLYLGNSNGACPFIGGVIEGNRVLRSTGYCMEIKYQTNYQPLPIMPDQPQVTIIRNNVFVKDDRPSPDGVRPNILVDGFPDSGAGSQDHYEIYGNFFFYNASERLFQGSGRIAMHDNIFVNSAGSAVIFQAHDGKAVKKVHFFNNTIYATGTGVSGAVGSESHAIAGNLIFAQTPIGYSGTAVHDNIAAPIVDAATYVVAASFTLGQMNFYPRQGQCQGATLDMSLFNSYADYNRDFNGTNKGGFTFRGAYAGQGVNPGWQLDSTLKTSPGLGSGILEHNGRLVRHTVSKSVSVMLVDRENGISIFKNNRRFDIRGRALGPSISRILKLEKLDN